MVGRRLTGHLGGSFGPQYRALCHPPAICLKFQTKLAVVHSQIPVTITRYSRRHDFSNLLGHDANVCTCLTLVGKAIKAKAVIEVTEKDDIVLEPNI
jgi:hypothetical protein